MVALEAVEVIAGTRPINAVKAFQIELVHKMSQHPALDLKLAYSYDLLKRNALPRSKRNMAKAGNSYAALLAGFWVAPVKTTPNA